jgi:ubiquinone/menaquinone biosynthesis C-methylase UbiE
MEGTTRPFHFKQFTIYQDNCIMKVSTDSVLLGAWANVEQAKKVLDIGAGRGGDLMKLYHAKVKSAVCFDPNESSLSSGSDGAISRYNIFKKKYVISLNIFHIEII